MFELDNQLDNTNITCCKCFEILVDPVNLPCNHQYCGRCACSMVETNEVFVCAGCNQSHPNINKGTLPNYYDQNLANKLIQAQTNFSVPLVCEWCEDVPPSYYCPECDYALCEPCAIAVHKNKAKRNHNPLRYSDHSAGFHRSGHKKCTKQGHEEYNATFYCTQDNELCCAYCLQVGPHKNHKHVPISQAATEARSQISRHVENLGIMKARIEGVASDVHLLTNLYKTSYDQVESLLSERFEYFRKQIDSREVEARKALIALRKEGDRTLIDSRQEILKKANYLHLAGLHYKRMENAGSDQEVLTSKFTIPSMPADLPQLSGTGFRLSETGELHLSGLNLTLDINVTTVPGYNKSLGISLESRKPNSRLYNKSLDISLESRKPNPGYNKSLDISLENANRTRGLGNTRPISPARHAARSVFTFNPDQDVHLALVADGVELRCAPVPSTPHVGVRAHETFAFLRDHGLVAPGGAVTWAVRLDAVRDSFVGVVNHTEDRHSVEGFYWRPMHQGVFDGKAGHPTAALPHIPPCQNGDILTFTFNYNDHTLCLAVNNQNYGPIVTNLNTDLSPCFVFRANEYITFM